MPITTELGHLPRRGHPCSPRRTASTTAPRATQPQLAYLADSSGGDSGAGVFYYTDGSSEYTGQSHYIIGGSNGSFNVGASVHQFRDWVTTLMSSN